MSSLTQCAASPAVQGGEDSAGREAALGFYKSCGKLSV